MICIGIIPKKYNENEVYGFYACIFLHIKYRFSCNFLKRKLKLFVRKQHQQINNGKGEGLAGY